MTIGKKALLALAVLAISNGITNAQKPRPRPLPKANPIIFAVISDGKTVEPIAYVEKGKLLQPVSGGEDAERLAAFNRSYYRAGGAYGLIFGGANAGTVTVRSSDPKAECSANMAQVSVVSAKAKLKGNVMALATNVPSTKKGSGMRRLPTAAERTEIEALVRAELIANKVTAGQAKNLKYQNLTALDVDSDGSAEMVGSFWVDTSLTERALLFFVAEKGSDGSYILGYKEFKRVDQKEVMSGEIKSIDEGVYHERLLDVFDVDDDGVAEVFTYIQSFEGAGFNAYRREAGKWVLAFEGSNYHCGY